MYVKPPSQGRHGVKLPENYSGNAFSQRQQYSDMPPPLRTPNHIRNDHEYEERHMGDIPPEETETYTEPTFLANEPESQENIAQGTVNHAPASIFSSLLPRTGFGNGFPFGHGLGGEELLILAVMLMVFLSGNESGETDGELLLLLGLLLFAG